MIYNCINLYYEIFYKEKSLFKYWHNTDNFITIWGQSPNNNRLDKVLPRKITSGAF